MDSRPQQQGAPCPAIPGLVIWFHVCQKLGVPWRPVLLESWSPGSLSYESINSNNSEHLSNHIVHFRTCAKPLMCMVGGVGRRYYRLARRSNLQESLGCLQPCQKEPTHSQSPQSFTLSNLMSLPHPFPRPITQRLVYASET